MQKLKDLAARAGRWLGLNKTTAPGPARPTRAVKTDVFDEASWRDTWRQATALRDLADELGQRFDYVGDLLPDVWAAAYKASPQLQEVDPTRAVNHQIVRALLSAPDFGELRRYTVGDTYAAAMAVIAQGEALRKMLATAQAAAEAAKKAEQARRRAADAAQQVREAYEAAEAAADDGAVPDGLADRLQEAVDAAEAADRAAAEAAEQARRELTQALPGLRAAARAAVHTAAEQARAEAERAAGWGISPARLERMPFEERARLSRLLAGRRLARFAELIGRFKRIAAGERDRRVEETAGELTGVTLGDDLGRLVPSELAALAVPALHADFVTRLAEKRLLVYDTHGEAPAGKGPIVALVDCSWSMELTEEEGITREAWAKACALALLDQARAERRDFTGILFSDWDQQKVFRFPKGRGSIADVLEFGEHFYGGGTDFAAPLTLAVGLLEQDSHRGDVVLITDGEAEVEEEWLQQWQQRKQALGFRVFGVAVHYRPGHTLETLCDHLRQVTDLADEEAPRDLFQSLLRT